MVKVQQLTAHLVSSKTCKGPLFLSPTYNWKIGGTIRKKVELIAPNEKENSHYVFSLEDKNK